MMRPAWCPIVGLAVVVLTGGPAAARAQGVGSGAGVTNGGSVAVSTGVPNAAVALPEGAGAISGVVTDAATGTPLVGATVSLAVASRATIGRDTREVTDTKGRFVFSKLPAHDDYLVTAIMPGYFGGGYGQTRLDGGAARIVLTDGQWFSTANVGLSKGGVIGGTVLDERGEPVVGVYVHVLMQVPVSGLMQLASGPVAMTDDRGTYRISGLSPGTYIVAVPAVSATVPASAGNILGSSAPYAVFDADSLSRLSVGHFPIPPPPDHGRRFAYPPAYAPDATTPARATAVTLAAGESRTGIDVHLEATPASVISGRVDGLTDPIPGLTLRLLPAGLENLGTGSETGTALVGADGSFAFLNVPAGTYSIDLRRSVMEYGYNLGNGPRLPLPVGINGWSINQTPVDSATAGVTALTTTSGDDHDLWGRTTVTVAGVDVPGILVPLHHGSRVTGRVSADAKLQTQLASRPFGVRMRVEPASGSATSGGVVLQTGIPTEPLTFDLTGIAPGQYVLRFVTAYNPSGGTVVAKSIIANGDDYTYRPLDLSDGRDLANVQVVVTDQLPTLAGAVHTPDPTTKAVAVIAFPVEPEQWTNYGLTSVRIKTTAMTAQDAYRFTTLPEGDYYVVAVPLAERDSWQDPEYLKQAARIATRVSLRWGQTTNADIAVVHVK